MLLALKEVQHPFLIAGQVEAFAVGERLQTGAVTTARLIDDPLPQWWVSWQVVIPDMIDYINVFCIVQQTPTGVEYCEDTFPKCHIWTECIRERKDGRRCRLG